MKAKKHILILASWYPVEGYAFGGSFIRDQVTLLREAGHQLGVIYPHHVASFAHTLSHPIPHIEQKEVDQIPAYYSYTSSYLPTRYGESFNIKVVIAQVLKAYKQYIATYGIPDIIHAHSFLYGGIGAHAIYKKYGVPYQITEHLSRLITSTEFDTGQFPYYLQQVFSQAKTVVTVSLFFNEKLQQKLGVSTPFRVIPNTVNSLYFTPVLKDNTCTPVRLITIGRLRTIKNQSDIIEAVYLLKNTYQQAVYLTIIGDGIEADNLRSKIIERQLTDQIELIHQAPKPLILKKLQEAHILISASNFETFGLTIAEAHATGTPTLVVDAGGPRDFVHPNNGLLIPTNNPTTLAQGVLQLVKEYDKFNPFDISAQCKALFAKEAIRQQLEELLG